jgi:hypothetical protein
LRFAWYLFSARDLVIASTQPLDGTGPNIDNSSIMSGSLGTLETGRIADGKPLDSILDPLNVRFVAQGGDIVAGKR